MMHSDSHTGAGRPLIAFNGWFWTQRSTGSGQYLRQLVPALNELPTELQIIVYVPAHRDASVDEDWIDESRVSIIPLGTPFDRLNENLAKLWFEQIAVPRACRRDGADILHAPYWATPAVSPVPVVTTVHDVIPLVLPAYRKPALVKLYTHFVTWTMRRSTLVLADSFASRDDILRAARLPAERVRVVHLAVGPQYQPVKDRERLQAVRARYELPQQFVLYLGGFDPRKNVPLLIRAYSRLVATDESTPDLVIAGKLPDRQTAFFSDPRDEARLAGIAEQVRFAGEIAEADKPALYSLATCFVFPSTYEGFGLPMLEAMACGAPVVTSRTSSLGELAGHAGLLVDPHSEEEIACAISLLIKEASTHEDYAARALARSRQFQWSETARLTAQAYQDILTFQTDQKHTNKSPLV